MHTNRRLATHPQQNTYMLLLHAVSRSCSNQQWPSWQCVRLLASSSFGGHQQVCLCWSAQLQGLHVLSGDSAVGSRRGSSGDGSSEPTAALLSLLTHARACSSPHPLTPHKNTNSSITSSHRMQWWLCQQRLPRQCPNTAMVWWRCLETCCRRCRATSRVGG